LIQRGTVTPSTIIERQRAVVGIDNDTKPEDPVEEILKLLDGTDHAAAVAAR
jgi:hypothetical protein